MNHPDSKNYSIKNTTSGRRDMGQERRSMRDDDLGHICEEIMVRTFLHDMFVEDFFKQYEGSRSAKFEISITEFEKAL